mmetsp:Transcript_35687/g.83531  ORF Transcript_35687/g.83531 Transcript_35687/m.83531 type:complete len:276 (+) Transcript_35687:131-958(+)
MSAGPGSLSSGAPAGSTSVGAPGAFPGRHPASHIPNSSAYSMASGRKEPRSRGLSRVGPGAYVPKHFFTEASAPQSAFSSEARPAPSSHQQEATPAGTLLHADNPKYKKAPHFSFGGASRQVDLSHMPHMDGFQMGENERRPVPGPGQHSPEDRSTSKFQKPPAFSVASKPSGSFALARQWDSPGPGAYSVDTPRPSGEGSVNSTVGPLASPRCKFGLAPRMPGERQDRHPGPGHYGQLAVTRTGHAAICSSHASPRWTMAGRGEISLASCYWAQ